MQESGYKHAQVNRLPENTIFILGTHRTGTTSMAQWFAKHYPEVAAFDQYRGARLVNLCSTLYLEGKISSKLMANITELVCGTHIRQCRKNTYIVSSGFHYVAVRFLQGQYPQVKVLHLVRDPRDWVVSYLNWINSRWQSKLANRILPWWNPQAHKVGQMSHEEWESLDLFGRFCWLWAYKNALIEKWYSPDKQAYLRIKFEDFAQSANPDVRQRTLENITQFCGVAFKPESLQFFDVPLNVSRVKSTPQWLQWQRHQCFILHRYCGNLMERYGYGNEPAWQAVINSQQTNP